MSNDVWELCSLHVCADVRMSLGVSGVSWAASAACVVWTWTAFALGSKYKALGSAALTAGQAPAERSSQSVTLPVVAGGSGGGERGSSMDGASGGSSSILITHAGELRWQGRQPACSARGCTEPYRAVRQRWWWNYNSHRSGSRERDTEWFEKVTAAKQ
jgi:hypothetical protein